MPSALRWCLRNLLKPSQYALPVSAQFIEAQYALPVSAQFVEAQYALPVSAQFASLRTCS
jgi:hypothetical protein